MSADPLGISPDIAPCVLHKTHGPRPYLNELHHVILESWTLKLNLPQSRKVSLCPTGHVNLHAVVRDRIAQRASGFRVPANLKALVDEAVAFWEIHKVALSAPGVVFSLDDHIIAEQIARGER
jgi:hypothetical protein